MRIKGSYPKINISSIKDIPIPPELDEDLVRKISELGQKITEGKLEFKNKTKDKLNELIYDLSYLER